MPRMGLAHLIWVLEPIPSALILLCEEAVLFISADFRIKKLSAFLSFILQPEMIKTWGLFVLLPPDLHIYISKVKL